MLVITTRSGAEIRVPLDEVESISEVDPDSGRPRELPRHPYMHREGINRCMACWQPRADASHSDVAVHSAA